MLSSQEEFRCVPQITYFQLSLRFNKIKHDSLEICTRKISLKLWTDCCYFNDYLFSNFGCYQYQSPMAAYISVENTVLFILWHIFNSHFGSTKITIIMESFLLPYTVMTFLYWICFAKYMNSSCCLWEQYKLVRVTDSNSKQVWMVRLYTGKKVACILFLPPLSHCQWTNIRMWWKFYFSYT